MASFSPLWDLKNELGYEPRADEAAPTAAPPVWDIPDKMNRLASFLGESRLQDR